MPSYDMQERAFAAHIEDLLAAAGRGYRSRFTGFLDLHEAAIARRLTAHSEISVLFFGGYPQAERAMLGVFASDELPDEALFPIAPITARFRSEDPVGHRDLLGALLGLGLSRDAVGDLLLEKGRAVCFLTPPAAKLALREFCKAGRWGLRLEPGIAGPLPERRFEELAVHVSAMRLDCMTAALTNLSREKAQQFVRSGKAAVNGAQIWEPAYQIVPGSVLSLRGYGKFLFEMTLRTTKKNRLVLQCRKYL